MWLVYTENNLPGLKTSLPPFCMSTPPSLAVAVSKSIGFVMVTTWLLLGTCEVDLLERGEWRVALDMELEKEAWLILVKPWSHLFPVWWPHSRHRTVNEPLPGQKNFGHDPASIILHSVSVIWSSDILSFWLYSQFYVGPGRNKLSHNKIFRIYGHLWPEISDTWSILLGHLMSHSEYKTNFRILLNRAFKWAILGAPY